MAERKKLTPKTLPRSVPEESADWQRGQEWVQTNMAAQALNAYRQFKIKTAQDAYDYVISQGGTPEQASMARDEVTRGFARSELATTAMTPLGPARGAAAVTAPARETLAITGPSRNLPALPPPRISPTPGSAAQRGAETNRAYSEMSDVVRRAELNLPSAETVRTIESTPTTVRPTPGSPAANFRDQPVLTLDQQRAALGRPPAQQEQINEAIRLARLRATIEAMPVEVSPTVGSAAQRGAELNRAYAGQLQADRRAALGLPRQTQAELEALDLARMADEGPVPQKVYRMPDDVAQYRRVVNDRYEPMPRRPVQAEVVRMDPVEAASAKTLSALETPAEAAQAARPGAMTVSGGYSPPINYGPFNQTINSPRGGSTLPILAGLGIAGGLGGAGYLATRGRGAPPAAGGAPVAAPTPALSGEMPQDLTLTGEGGSFPELGRVAPARTMPETRREAPAPAPQRAEVPLPPTRPERIGRAESVESLWRKYNESGNPADFVRASRAMQQDMPGFGMEREGQARGGKTQKPDSVHKALEIIHHLISSR